MRRLPALATLLLVVGASLVACGGSSKPSGSSLPAEVIDVTFTGTSTDPSGDTIDVAVGQRIELHVTADAPGEIHVHSSPDEQEFQYQKGTSTIQVKPIQAPGRVVVESHTLNKTLFVLQAT
jgi:hypothetical protein